METGMGVKHKLECRGGPEDGRTVEVGEGEQEHHFLSGSGNRVAVYRVRITKGGRVLAYQGSKPNRAGKKKDKDGDD
jgi:hypothetical protein